MSPVETLRVGYVVKRYPRYSETFIVNEILAHESAGLAVEIFSLRPPIDSHFQDRIARVRAPVTYLASEGVKTADFWEALRNAASSLPDFWDAVHAASSEEAGDVYQAALLARQVQAKGIRHLHAHFASVATSVARLAARFAGISYSFTAHAKDIFHANVDHEDFTRKLADAAAVVTVSDYNRRYLLETYGRAASRVERIYNGLDLVELPYEPPAHRAPLAVGVGRLVEKKGFADLIEACALVTPRRDFQCQIIGVGELETALCAQINRFGLEGTVQLLGPRPQAEVMTIVQSASAVVVPSVIGTDGNRDGLPTVLLEAMALGTPCVSTDVTGIPEVLRHGETGLMVPQHDPAAIAAAIERLLLDSELRVELARRARRLIEGEFDVHRNTSRLREVFAQACALEVS